MLKSIEILITVVKLTNLLTFVTTYTTETKLDMKKLYKGFFCYYNSFWGFSFEAVLNFTFDTSFENILSDEWLLPCKTLFKIYMYIYQSFFPLILEMLISWLEACGDAVTDKYYCKKSFIFPQFIKTVK